MENDKKYIEIAYEIAKSWRVIVFGEAKSAVSDYAWKIGHSSMGTSNFPTSLWFSQGSVLVHTVGNVWFLSENWSLSDRTTKMRFNSLDSIALCWFYRLWDYRSFMIFCTAWLVAFQEFCEIRVKKNKTEIHLKIRPPSVLVFDERTTARRLAPVCGKHCSVAIHLLGGCLWYLF